MEEANHFQLTGFDMVLSGSQGISATAQPICVLGRFLAAAICSGVTC